MSDALPLSEPAIESLAKVDMFFVSSSYREKSMGTKVRGGPPGFVRIATNDSSETVLAYPEDSGNRLYQTLGNLDITPKAGLVFPDLDTGSILYITGTTEIIFGRDAATILPRSSLVVKVHAARFVQHGLSFRGAPGERSPYNSPVRFLTLERAQADALAKNDSVAYAKLLAQDMLTPTIARFRFSVSNLGGTGKWKPGQYVAFAFEDELSLGYSHMRDDDPKSLNDDYIRTFTVSSSLGGNLHLLKSREFASSRIDPKHHSDICGMVIPHQSS